MSESDRGSRDGCATGKKVKVRAANPAGVHAYQCLTVARNRDRDTLQPKGFTGRVESGSLHRLRHDFGTGSREVAARSSSTTASASDMSDSTMVSAR
jgi:hypothetical protein